MNRTLWRGYLALGMTLATALAGVASPAVASPAAASPAAPSPAAAAPPTVAVVPLAAAAIGASVAAGAPAAGAAAQSQTAPGVLRAKLEQWHLADSQSGPVNYYSLQRDAGRSFLRGSYQPPNKKAVFGFEVPERSRNRLKHLDWDWRAIKFPLQGDECVKEKGDSAAVLYVTWRRFLRWYSLKYVWSTTRKPGTICDRRRNTFVAQDTVVLESGGPTGVWKHESIDLTREFRAHFGEGDDHADVPPLMGLGVMSDGDQTKTESSGDFSEFVLSP